MNSTNLMIEYERDGGYINELTTTPTRENNPSIAEKWRPYRRLRLSPNESQLLNDGADKETVTIEVVDGLEVARGTDPSNATVLSYDGDVTLTFDGVEMTKMFTNGSVSFDLTTEKPAGSEIEIVAESLADHPAESDRAVIEVVSQ